MLENEYGGQPCIVINELGQVRTGTIRDRTPGRLGFIGVLYDDGEFEFEEDSYVTIF